MIRNSILIGFNPDPFLCRAGDDYYIAVSTFEWYPGVRIHHSRDLAHWRVAAHPLNRPDLLLMKGDPDSAGVWAPCLTYSDGIFWLVYSDVKVVEGDAFKDVANYLTTYDRVDGEWSSPVYLNGVGFDVSLFHDDDGRKYLLNIVWDYRPGNHRFNGISLQEYDYGRRRLVGKRKLIFRGTDLGLTEAPYLYKWNGMYYLLTAEGGTGYEHAATLARSRTIDGEYELHPDNPLLTSWHDPKNPLQKAGHAFIIEAGDGRWYLAHLVGHPLRTGEWGLLEDRGYCPLGRETALQELEWRDGWPRIIIGGNLPKMEVAAPGLPETPWPDDCPVRDDFDSETLNYHFQTLRAPFTDEIGSLTARKGYLRLYGRESPQSTFVQSQVSRRWESLWFDAETALEFRPETFQQMAGLVCYYNTRNWVYAFVNRDEEKGRVIDIMQCDRNHSSLLLNGNRVVVPEGAIRIGLRVSVWEKTFRFLYSFDGEKWTALPAVFSSLKLSDEYIRQWGFFTGAFVGMMANDLSGSGLHADFDYFSYREIQTPS
jgi:xylan 1,4-beta-xylosidase